MTDLEITRLCAKAMGIKIRLWNEHMQNACYVVADNQLLPTTYGPLHDDAQSMALFYWLVGQCLQRHWEISIDGYLRIWPDAGHADDWESGFGPVDSPAAWRRAICECAAHMQQRGER